jgi:ferritin-like metal-binding protein YciE
MDASPDVLAESVRARRAAIDHDLEQLRARLERADPRRRINGQRAAAVALPVAAGTAALWLWRSRRRRMGSLDELLVSTLSDLYNSEREMPPALDRMRAAASNDELAHEFARHRTETERHLERLQRVFKALSARPTRRSSGSTAAIIAEGERLMSRGMARNVRDAALIATAQRIEHLEIAAYASACSQAKLLGFLYAAELLQLTLEEEEAMDRRLTRLAEGLVNAGVAEAR